MEINGNVIYQDLDPVLMRLPEFLSIGRVDVVGRHETVRIHTLDQEKHDAPVSVGNQALKL